ncbi:hypothetical protein BHE74_00059397, partial [Ensete ventricosum]
EPRPYKSRSVPKYHPYKSFVRPVCTTRIEWYVMVLNFLDAENLENDHSLVMLANKLKAVAEKEHSLFSPVLCQQYPEAGIVAAVLLHQLYGKHLRNTVVNRARWGKPDCCPKQLQVGCKCKLAGKLLEPLMRSATTNKTSVKLSILHEWRKHNLVCQPGKGVAKRDLQRWKPASIFLKRAWRNSTKAKKGFLR